MSPPNDKEASKGQSKNKPKKGKSKDEKQTEPQTQTQKQNSGPKNRGYYFGNRDQNHRKPTIILPHLHKAVITSLSGAISPEPVYIRPGSHGQKVAETYQTHIDGFFTCPNSCFWSSGKVAIVIRRFALTTGMGYNATVYNQRCDACNGLGAINIDKEVYIERVAYRLKVWAGVPVERPFYDKDNKTPPHKMELCEGCKRGVCLAGQLGNAQPSGSGRGTLMF